VLRPEALLVFTGSESQRKVSIFFTLGLLFLGLKKNIPLLTGTYISGLVFALFFA
jgi:hypothetical protein